MDSLHSMTPEALNKARREATELRKEVMEQLVRGDISFIDVLILSDGEKNATLRTMKIWRMLSEMSGWTESSARRALVANGFSEQLTVRKVKRNKDTTKVIAHLFDTSAHQWEQRTKAPEGFPWDGNILATLEELDNNQFLPDDVAKAVRYEFPDNNYEKTRTEEPAQLVDEDDEDDNLASLLMLDDDELDDEEDEE